MHCRNELKNLVNRYPCFYFTHDISSDSVNFLDVKLTIENHRITSPVHFKRIPTTVTCVIDFIIFPLASLNIVPYSQLLRARRICSEKKNFLRYCFCSHQIYINLCVLCISDSDNSYILNRLTLVSYTVITINGQISI